MTKAQKSFLATMVKYDGHRSAATWGKLHWDDKGVQHRKPQVWARPAGAVLQRLERLGFVRPAYDEYGKTWTLTVAGRKAGV